MSENKVDVAELRGLLEKATQRPWVHDIEAGYSGIAENETGNLVADCTSSDFTKPQDAHNAALMVAAVNALPSLLDQFEQSQREVETLKGFAAQSALNSMLAGTGSLMPSVHGSGGGGLEAINTPDPNRTLKRVASEYRARAEASEALVARLTAELAIEKAAYTEARKSTGNLADQIARLREVLKAIVTDIEDYECANNLAPNSGRSGCSPRGITMGEKTGCPTCGDEGWVCENHPDKPWNEVGCECGAGMPCRICNPCTRDFAPRMPQGFTENED